MRKMIASVTVNFEILVKKLDQFFNKLSEIQPKLKPEKARLVKRAMMDIMVFFAPLIYIHVDAIDALLFVGTGSASALTRPIERVWELLLPRLQFIGDCFSYRLATGWGGMFVYPAMIYWAGFLQISWLLAVIGRVLFWMSFCLKKIRRKQVGQHSATLPE